MRQYCKKCLKVSEACYCQYIKSISNSKKIIILQHPTEVAHPLGTAKMAELTFKNIDLFVGEDFNECSKLKSLLINSRPALFKPGQESVSYEEAHIDFDTLIFLDGTWKKANKIYYMNRFLQEMPHVSFNGKYSSIYRLRKEPKENYLSTFEAILKTCEIDSNKDLSSSLKALEYIQQFQEGKTI